jgi:hypothetical protein
MPISSRIQRQYDVRVHPRDHVVSTSEKLRREKRRTPGSSSNMTLSITFSKTFSTTKPLSFARSKKARSFSNNHGLYGVKNTSAVPSFFNDFVTVWTSLPCSEWLNNRSARIKTSNASSGLTSSVRGKVSAPQRYPLATIGSEGAQASIL